MTVSEVRSDYGAMQLAIFRGEDPGSVLWQPRLDWWYKVNKARGTLPDHLKDATMLDVYDYAHASCRYFLWDRSWLRDHTWLRSEAKNVRMTTIWEDDMHLRSTWETPLGTLSQLLHFDEWRVSSHIVEYRVKTAEDFKILHYILEDESWYWDDEQFQTDMKTYGAYGTPQFYFRRSPVQRLFIEEMGLQQAIYFMMDEPDLFEEYVQRATTADDAMYDVIKQSPVHIVNLGENIDGFIDSPAIWRDHLAPYYRKRVTELHDADKFVSIHVDGTMKSLLPYLQDAPYDAIEAATPAPQGDVTLEQIKDALGDVILMDGIPALYMIADQYPVDTLTQFVEKMVELFHPRLVLGVSDEFPPDGDIERARLIGEMVKTMGS